MKQGILCITASDAPVTCSARADLDEPVAYIPVKRGVDCGLKRQQACDVDRQIHEVRIVLVFQIEETNIQVAIVRVPSEVKAESVISAEEIVAI